MKREDFIAWAAELNAGYERARARYRELHPHITLSEIVRRETEVKERKIRWLEKLRGMRD